MGAGGGVCGWWVGVDLGAAEAAARTTLLADGLDQQAVVRVGRDGRSAVEEPVALVRGAVLQAGVEVGAAVGVFLKQAWVVLLLLLCQRRRR
jgi:hypothetical protein